MSKVKLLGDKQILIGERTFPIFHHDPPIHGVEYSLETTSDSRNTYQPQLYVRQLNGVTPGMLPNRLSISISNPKSTCRFIDYLEIKKQESNSLMTISLTFYYSKWDYTSNLVQWAEVFRNNLLSTIKEITTANKDRDEYGVSFACDVNMSENDDIFEAFEKLDSAIEAVYMESIKSAESAPLRSVSEQLSSKRGELKWWIQYVIVPLLGSGAFAAIIAWLITH